MALETVTIVLDKNWALLANSSGLFKAEVKGGTALFSVGASAPEDGSYLGHQAGSLVFADLAGKVWARALADSYVTISVTRVIDVANTLGLLLPAATLSATQFLADSVPGTEIAVINLGMAGATVTNFSPNDGRVVLSKDGTKLLRGLTPMKAEAAPTTIEVVIYSSHPKAPNSPRRTVITLTATFLQPVLRADFPLGLRIGLLSPITHLGRATSSGGGSVTPPVPSNALTRNGQSLTRGGQALTRS